MFTIPHAFYHAPDNYEEYKKNLRNMKSNLINPQPKYMTDDRRYF